MIEPVNLNRFRKNKARAEKSARANQNAAKFGQSKAQKKHAQTKVDAAARLLDQHKLQP